MMSSSIVRAAVTRRGAIAIASAMPRFAATATRPTAPAMASPPLARSIWSTLTGASADAATTGANINNGSGGALLSNLKNENPYVDVVQYAHKNRTWSIQHVDYYSEALAIGLAENGLTNGDVVLSWLPSYFSEQMVLQFACSKAGFVLYTLDPALAVQDPTKAQAALAAALSLTKANVLVGQEAGSDVNYIRLAEAVVPELRIFDYSTGMPFVTPRYPDLRLCVHTGFDQEDKWGWLPLRHMVVPSNNLDSHVNVSAISKSTPLAGSLVLSADGIPTSIGPVLTNEQVHEKKIWPTYSNVLDRKFHQVEGVGVIF